MGETRRSQGLMYDETRQFVRAMFAEILRQPMTDEQIEAVVKKIMRAFRHTPRGADDADVG